MMCKHPEKRDVFDYGLTVLELLLTAIMCLRMSGMGECCSSLGRHSLSSV